MTLASRNLLASLSVLALLALPASAQTVGPAGEAATPSSEITLDDAQVAELKGKGLKAALLWHDQADFVNAVTAGATDEFTRLGIEVVATTSAGFDSAKQLADVETALALDPDIILSLPIDPVAAGAAFKKASAAGVKLVFLSNLPADYKHPGDYAAIVTDDLFQMGKQAADVLAASMGGKGKVGWIYHDAAYYVTNQRDNAFKATIQADYPDMQIVAEAGISDPARAEEIANAMLLQNPDLGGIYVTCGLPFLIDLIPKVIGTSDNSPAMIKDMVGELANTISGNATKAFGKNFNISVPIILEGVPKSLTLPIDTPTYVIPVQWQSHKLFLVVGISNK